MTAALVTGGVRPGTPPGRCPPADVTLDDLAAAARGVCEPAALRERLTGLLDDPVELEALAMRSYRHANGFAKIVLGADAAAEITLRLHVWAPVVGPALRGETDPHGHRWRFVSSVVAGAGLDVVHFEETAATDSEAEPFHCFDYDPRSADAMHPRGMRSLRVVDRPQRVMKDSYRCDVDVVHTIEPVDEAVVATIVVQGPSRLASTPVYRRARNPSLPPRDRLGLDEVGTYLDLVLGAMPAGGVTAECAL